LTVAACDYMIRANLKHLGFLSAFLFNALLNAYRKTFGRFKPS